MRMLADVTQNAGSGASVSVDGPVEQLSLSHDLLELSHVRFPTLKLLPRRSVQGGSPRHASLN